MASVQMSMTLRDQICEKYRKQLQIAYRKEHDIQPAIDVVRKSFSSEPVFNKAIEIQKQWETLLPDLDRVYPKERDMYHGVFSDHLLLPQTKIGFVCNPNRPSSDHLKCIEDWHTEYLYEDWSQNKELKPASKSFVEGDVGVKLDNLEPFYMPQEYRMSYTQYRSDNFAPNSNTALLITDSKLCDQLSAISYIEEKIISDLGIFRTYIDQISTLKKFLDEWPGGLDLVPQEYKDRMVKKVTKTVTKRLTPTQIIPDALKTQMNEVVLENKLLGDD